MDWITAFTIYLASQGIPNNGVNDGPNGNHAQAKIWYQSSATAQQISTAEAAKATFVVPPQANPQQFLIDCNNDATLPANSRIALNVIALWQQNGNSNLALSAWTNLKASLTAGQISAVQSHATANAITLP